MVTGRHLRERTKYSGCSDVIERCTLDATSSQRPPSEQQNSVIEIHSYSVKTIVLDGFKGNSLSMNLLFFKKNPALCISYGFQIPLHCEIFLAEPRQMASH